ncbi:tRNA (adenosine(37)-N6)-dimethylallyltransferase MiaA [Brachybacterium paraconglomeratum]|uniref:tRNA (adenosine(37)-N6)-dimethylallyltransferase MiaA n=1 Tax=Brachybacterium paraconglomeratum TaxID=173362 RepID=UPI0021A5CABF|nr:tRNA (adenosine(37)-N6)-dimethylallyltransferase MiaA [Brachybacterium paraconglomeratum]MCT1908930.1 tRNA (adenosine(37)-N6)-dimethylallyltransferase MiaA [Brachybacterium paraconglomeratum]
MEYSAQDPVPASADTPLIAVVGATATGKSDLAIALARQLDGEVINADALQLYRGMDIGTAKVTPEERAGVPHHLLDVLEVTEEASVSAYQRDAREAIAAIRSRRRTPILVGGSGLYVRAVLDDIEFPPTDAALRERLEQRIAQEGTEALHRELAASDPEAAGIIGPRDARRIVRALEVGALTGRPFTAFLPRPLYADASTVQIGLRRDRALLHERIAVRVDRMVEGGLLEEIRVLREMGLDRGLTARRAIGYEQGLAVLDGTLDCAQAIQDTVTGTRRLVRKQDTWFRRDARVRWLDADEDADGTPLLTRALAVLEAQDTAAGDARP